jgi:4'-phosphopantetheinyl transferase
MERLQSTLRTTAADGWDDAPETIELTPGEVHLWRAHLPQQISVTPALWSLLSEEERTRASQFHFPDDSHRYVFSHGVVREILLRYHSLVKPPLDFVVASKGQPQLLQAPGESKLKFNLSHSRSLLLFAVTLDRQIGIDVEHVSLGVDWQSVAKRYFSFPEWRSLFAVPESGRVKSFLTRWTRKEAYVKARGEGLSMSLAAFSILPSPDGTLKVLDASDPAAASAWSPPWRRSCTGAGPSRRSWRRSTG